MTREASSSADELTPIEHIAMRMGGNDVEAGMFQRLRDQVRSKTITLKEAIERGWAIVNGKNVDH